MEIVAVASPQYSKPDNSTIDCWVTFSNQETYPYTSATYDNAPYGPQLWADLNAGKYGTIAPYPLT